MRFPLLLLLALGLGCNASAADAADCGPYPPIENEAGCPATFDAAILYTSCSQVGLQCRYPEKEYGTPPDVCNGPLLITCDTSASDASTGEWFTPLP